MNGKAWTKAEDLALASIYSSKTTAEVAGLLNRSVSSINGRAATLGLYKTPEQLAATSQKSVTFRFAKGAVPRNKGLRRPGWFAGRMRETQFKKGERKGAANASWKPVGTVLFDGDGYLRKKVMEPPSGTKIRGRVWEIVHLRVWRDAHGPVPAGHAVVFKNGDKGDVRLANLECISRAELMRRNSIHRHRTPELKEAIYALIALKSTITKTEKRGHAGTAAGK